VVLRQLFEDAWHKLEGLGFFVGFIWLVGPKGIQQLLDLISVHLNVNTP